MKQKYGEGLIGLKVALVTNGDISCLMKPNNDLKRNFGPTYGSQHKVYGTIVDFNIDFEAFGDYDAETHKFKRKTQVRIWIEYNDEGKLGLHTSEWNFDLEDFREFIAYVKENVKQEE